MEINWQAILDAILQWALGFGLNVLAAAAIFFGGWYLAKIGVKFLKKVMSRGKLDPLVLTFVGSVVKTLVIAVATISALAKLGINISSMVAALGAAGLTASFALQGSLSNLVSGLQIIFMKPFKMGDYLSFGTYEGTVKKIAILATTLATFDNKEVIIPNSKITNDVVVNFSTNTTRRIDFKYGVSYHADLKKAKNILASIVTEEARILPDPAPVVAVGELQDSAVILVAKVWCKTEDYWPLYHEMQEKVKLTFDKEGISIPFPQLDVHLDQKSISERTIFENAKWQDK
jgi:small conductance mechanosensitive channel